jgi:hypothetical protein
LLVQHRVGHVAIGHPIRRGIEDDGLDRRAEQPARRVGLGNFHQDGIAQKAFLERHGAARGMQDADADRPAAVHGGSTADGRSGGRQ